MAECSEEHEYTKREGTSGVRGHLYETKLLSLIYFRLLHDDNIEQFYLGTNVDKLGAFDDICFRAKVKGYDRPIAVFIQAKHRENNSVLTISNEREMEKYYNSFSEIRNKFQAGNEDKLFEGTCSDTQCLFVIYTTAKSEKNFTIYEGAYADILNDTIATADGATTAARDPRDTLLSRVILEDHMCALAQKMAKCIHGEIRDHQELSTDELVLRYHVVLAKTFFNVSDDQSDGCRTACFKKDFLEKDRKDRSLILFKDELCTQMVKRRNVDVDERSERCAGLDDCNFNIVDNNIVVMYRHIARSIVYKNRKFQFIHKTSSEKHKVILDKINSTGSNVHSALKEALSEYLASKQFKVPAWFGNKDLTLRGDEKKQERKLNDLTSWN
uniref:Uncharacterized protein n=1 Tax=Heliothis virescens TaxID=7102 RepID=A0A2A4IT74_HELVI